MNGRYEFYAHPFVRFEPPGCKNAPPKWVQKFQMNPPKSQ